MKQINVSIYLMGHLKRPFKKSLQAKNGPRPLLATPDVKYLRMRDSYTNPSETKRIESFEIFGLTNRIHETGI